MADVCLLGHQDTILWKNKVVVTYSDDCFMKQVRVAQGAGAKSLIVLSTELTVQSCWLCHLVSELKLLLLEYLVFSKC